MTAFLDAAFLDELRAAAGAPAVLTDAPDIAPFCTDWRRRYTGSALAVAQPATTAETARIVQTCARHGVAIVPQGGNTGLVGGATPAPDARAIVLSTRRMHRIRAIDTTNDCITVEAGCTLRAVQDAARDQGRLFPLRLASEGSCTIGGNLATNAGGTEVLRYGNARELTLGIEAVLADGRVWNGLRPLRKDNSGYDLKQWFIGSEGTLAIITAASLKLFAAPRAQLVALAALPNLNAALALLACARAQAGPALTAFEVLAEPAVELVARHDPAQRRPFPVPHPWLALLEWTDHESDEHAAAGLERLCAHAIETGLARDVAIARTLADCADLWRLRESVPEAQARAGGNVKHDISLPLEAWTPFLAETETALTALDRRLQIFAFGHLGDGNLHYNVGTVAGTPSRVAFELEREINDIVFGAVERHRGSVAAEHGVGQLRRELAGRVKPPIERELMRTIKSALDPDGRFNPGKVL